MPLQWAKMPGARMRRRKKLRDERAVQGEGGQQEEEDVSNQLFGDDDNGDDLEVRQPLFPAACTANQHLASWVYVHASLHPHGARNGCPKTGRGL